MNSLNLISSNIVNETNIRNETWQQPCSWNCTRQEEREIVKTNKMAACSFNIVEELYSLIDNDPYESDIQLVDADTQPNAEELKKVRKLLDKAYKTRHQPLPNEARKLHPKWYV